MLPPPMFLNRPLEVRAGERALLARVDLLAGQGLHRVLLLIQVLKAMWLSEVKTGWQEP